MNREQAKANLMAFGIEEPTDDNITSYLNQVNGETKRANDRADKLKADADKVTELQRQLDELNNANLSEIEKANKAKEESESKVAMLEKQVARMQMMNQLANMGIVGEDAENLIDNDGKVSFETLGKIINQRETNARAEKEKELLANTPNPQGNGDGDNNAKPADVLNAESISFGAMGVSAETKDYYVL